MGVFLSYTLQAAVVMAMIYLVYKWLMSRCTFHALNRVSLLAAIALSWALPALMPLFRPKPMVDVEFGIPIPLADVNVADPQSDGKPAMKAEGNGAPQEEFAPAYFVNGRLFTGAIDDIAPERIRSMSVVKNDPAYPQGKIMIEMLAPGEEKPAPAAERMADFKGGQTAMIDFLKQNLRFPENVKLSKTERVIVQFVVGTDGSVSDEKVLRGASEEDLNAEALRVVGLMDGHWEPAIENGRPVATHFTLPVQFSPNAPKSE